MVKHTNCFHGNDVAKADKPLFPWSYKPGCVAHLVGIMGSHFGGKNRVCVTFRRGAEDEKSTRFKMGPIFLGVGNQT